MVHKLRKAPMEFTESKNVLEASGIMMDWYINRSMSNAQLIFQILNNQEEITHNLKKVRDSLRDLFYIGCW